MIFSSAEFLFLFLPLALALFFAARRFASLQIALGAITVASLVFYGVWKPSYLVVLGVSIVANHLLSKALGPDKPHSRKALAAGIILDLGILAYFKYLAFASSIVADLGLIDKGLASVALPLGISFYTFQQITYLVDRHNGKAPPAPFGRYVLFVCFFPQLIAGPIVHHSQMMPQLEHPKPNWATFGCGLFVFAIGLAKKTIIADPIGVYVDIGFANPGGLATFNAWILVLAYTCQLYFDFSGYSDMAVGLGLLFGVKLPWNFLSPYKARNIMVFWRTWHVTLSNFLKDYVYIPLGGSRCGKVRLSINLMLTMTIGGIWHGAGWTFLLWGILHGGALVVCHNFSRTNIRLPFAIAWPATFLTVILGWVLFRATTIDDAMGLYRAMFGANQPITPYQMDMIRALPYIIAALALAFVAPNAKWWYERYKPTLWWGIATGALLAAAIFFVRSQANAPEFLYFDF